jgi:F0F1-type ATP synthase membrane subunit b/b'
MAFTGQDAIAIVALAVAMVKIFRGPIGVAIAERIRGGAAPAEDPALAAEVDHLRGRLAEVEERLDFAERLLAQAREADQLPGGTHR